MLKIEVQIWTNSRSSNLQSRPTFISDKPYYNIVPIIEKMIKLLHSNLKIIQHTIFLYLIKIKIIQSMIQLKNALHVQPIETTLHITFYLILFHKSLLSKISNQNVKKKASIARFKYSSKTYITIYTWHFPFLHSKNKFTDLSEISPLLLLPTISFTDGCNNGPIGLQRKKKRGIFSRANRDFIESFRNSDI